MSFELECADLRCSLRAHNEVQWEIQSLLTPVFWRSTLQMYYFFTLFSLRASTGLIRSSGAVCTWENESHYNIMVCDQAHSHRPEHMARLQCACAK